MIEQFEEIFGQALSAWRAGPYDGHTVDQRLATIADRDPQAAVGLARRYLTEPGVERAVACQLLAVAAQRGDERTRVTVADMAIAAYASERDADVLVGIVRAIGGAQDRRGLPVLTALATHPSVQVRIQVAGEMPLVMDDPPEAAAVAALIALTSDVEPDVRDWATFALGTQTDADSGAVRQALWERVADPNRDTRDEAVVALARRGDSRMSAVVTDLLAMPSVSALIFEAAAFLADPALLTGLRRFDDADSDVAAAIDACERGQSPPR